MYTRCLNVYIMSVIIYRLGAPLTLQGNRHFSRGDVAGLARAARRYAEGAAVLASVPGYGTSWWSGDLQFFQW